MRRTARRAVLVATAMVAGLAAFTPASFAGALVSVRVPGTLYGVGCMTRVLCVANGVSSGQGYRPEWFVLRSGREIRSFRVQNSYGGAASISCFGTNGCVGLAALENGAVVLTFNRAGVPSRRTVRTGQRDTSFSSLWCGSVDRCELAGWDTLDSEVVIASWNGSRLGGVQRVPIPNGSRGGGAPAISCALSWCQLAMNPSRPSGSHPNTQQAFLITTHNGRVVAARWIKGYQADSVACTAAGRCYLALTNNPLAPVGHERSRGYLAPVIGRVVGSPRPTALIDPAVACRGSVCVGVADNQIATYRSGVQHTLVSVRGARSFREVQLGPGAFFAAVSPSNGGSILTTGTP